MTTHLLDQVRNLSLEEQLELVEALWNSITQRGAVSPLTQEQRAELDRRLAVPVGTEAPQLDVEIDRLYERIWSLISEKKDDPNLPAAVAPLRKRLRELQEKEADMMEQRTLARLRFDPNEWQQFLAKSRGLLGDR
jgi:hypothetical protein